MTEKQMEILEKEFPDGFVFCELAKHRDGASVFMCNPHDVPALSGLYEVMVRAADMISLDINPEVHPSGMPREGKGEVHGES